MNNKYTLRCVLGGEAVAEHYTTACTNGHASLLRAEYTAKQLTVRELPGMFRFSDWLPVHGTLATEAGPVCFRSLALARELGLDNLYIGFNGYWPERGGRITTCSFKELEALPTVVRMREQKPATLVIASAGNTGRAFLQVSAMTGIPVVVVVPERAVNRLWTTVPAENSCVIAVKGDYTDAIRFGREVSALPEFLEEGGARNIARRDGMGTVMLDAAVTIGHMPDYYFQAIGSGTGGIAAWEASLRLRADGRFGSRLPVLHLCQNLPFAPMVHAWHAGRRNLVPEADMPDAEDAISHVAADVLTNREPPYSIAGGVFDALTDTGGVMSAVTNEEARNAGTLFEDLEGIDLDPAAAVCTASLLQACETWKIDRKKTVLLNITGGGYRRLQEDLARIPVQASFTVPAGTGIENIRKELVKMVRTSV
ncbi:MAG TPA: cysteate synthase [Methanoregulaceae archaeon]|nr:cysteate synthase [Methanoregulaceae archaeon]